MSNVADLFAADDSVLDDPADCFAVEPVVEPEVESPAGVIFSHCWFGIGLITVPDCGRFPVPGQFCAQSDPVDLSRLPEMAGGEVRKLIKPGLSDVQLAEVRQAELDRDKPRGIVMRAIEAEMQQRGQAFPEWVRRMSRNPLTCQIVAVAWQQGDDLPDAQVSQSGEYKMLVDLVTRWQQWCDRLGVDVVAAVDADWTLRVLTARLCQFGLFEQAQRFRRAEIVQLPLAFRQAAESERLTLDEIALAVGVDLSEYAASWDCMQIWQQFQQDPAAVQLCDWAACDLALQIAVLMAGSGLWDR